MSSRTLVVGDVHGCAEELDRLLESARPTCVIAVGDLFTKGPDPAGVWCQLRDRMADSVLGNHDVRLLDRVDGQRPEDAAAQSVVDALDKVDPSWLPWLRARPLTLEVEGWTVVHASIHPSGDLSKTTRWDLLYRRRWPETGPDDPRWVHVYTGERRVAFGHDAVQGRVEVRRDGRLHVVGLDAGCVYGGRLAGLLIEEERVFDVPARKVWRTMSRRTT